MTDTLRDRLLADLDRREANRVREQGGDDVELDYAHRERRSDNSLRELLALHSPTPPGWVGEPMLVYLLCGPRVGCGGDEENPCAKARADDYAHPVSACAECQWPDPDGDIPAHAVDPCPTVRLVAKALGLGELTPTERLLSDVFGGDR